MQLAHARSNIVKGFMASVYITKKVLKLKKSITLRPFQYEVDIVLK